MITVSARITKANGFTDIIRVEVSDSDTAIKLAGMLNEESPERTIDFQIQDSPLHICSTDILSEYFTDINNMSKTSTLFVHNKSLENLMEYVENLIARGYSAIGEPIELNSTGDMGRTIFSQNMRKPC